MQGNELFLNGDDLLLRGNGQVGLGNIPDGGANGLAVRGNGQVGHHLLHLMVEVAGHGVGQRGVKAHAGDGAPVVAGNVALGLVVAREVGADRYGHARLRQILPDGIRELQAFHFQIHGAVDEHGGLLDGQEDAVLEGKHLVGVIQVFHGGVELFPVFRRYAGTVFQPVARRQFRRLQRGLG